MANIIVASAVIPGSINTPLDARSRVSNEAEILDIENPSVGLLVYCSGTGKFYVIKTLKAKQIGTFLVDDAAVDTYEEFAPGSGDEELYAADVFVSDPDSFFGADNVEAVLAAFKNQLSEKVDSSRIGAVGGVASLGSDGKVPASQLPGSGDAIAVHPSTITLPIPTDGDGERISLVLDISSDGTFEEDEEGVPVNYCRVLMSEHYAKMRVFRNEVWETLSENCVGLPDYGSSVEFTLDTELFPGYVAGTKYYARYKWLDSNYAGDDWTGFSFRGDVADMRPIRLPDAEPLTVKELGELEGTLSFDYASGDVQNFALAADAELDLASVANVTFGAALILNCTPGEFTLTVSNGSDRSMSCTGDRVFVVVVTNFGSLQIAVTETI